MKRSHDSLFVGLDENKLLEINYFPSSSKERNEWNEILKMSTKQCVNNFLRILLSGFFHFHRWNGNESTARRTLSIGVYIHKFCIIRWLNTTNIDYTIGDIFPRGFQFIFCLYFTFLGYEGK